MRRQLVVIAPPGADRGVDRLVADVAHAQQRGLVRLEDVLVQLANREDRIGVVAPEQRFHVRDLAPQQPRQQRLTVRNARHLVLRDAHQDGATAFLHQHLAVAVVDVATARGISAALQPGARRQPVENVHAGPCDPPAVRRGDQAHDTARIDDFAEEVGLKRHVVGDDGGGALLIDRCDRGFQCVQRHLRGRILVLAGELVCGEHLAALGAKLVVHGRKIACRPPLEEGLHRALCPFQREIGAGVYIQRFRRAWRVQIARREQRAAQHQQPGDQFHSGWHTNSNTPHDRSEISD